MEYKSPFWSNKETWNVEAGLDGLAKNETKLASYHNTPFDKICLGMTGNDVTNWILVNYTATSLYSVLADGSYHETYLGREVWKSLISDARLQPNCIKEGFNAQCRGKGRKSRIGILTSDNNNCSGCKTVIGFGIRIGDLEWSSGYWHKSGTSENKKFTFGYIFVQ